MTGRIWRHIWGYVIIKVKGPRIERFLNRLAGSGVGVWHAQRLTPDMLVASVNIKGFKKIRALSRGQGWKVTIVEKVGLPFLVHALFRRKIFIIGCLWALLMIYGASGIVWFVRVESDEAPLSTEQIEEILELVAENGLKPGVRRSRVDSHRIRQTLLLEVDDLSWAAVDVQGVMATVDVVGRAGMGLAETMPGDLVAQRDGIITKVIVFSGQSVVEEGDVVRRGDVLISGFIPPTSPDHARRLEAEEPPYVRADGIVLARTWVEGKATVPLIDVIEHPTGRRRRTRQIELGSRRWIIGGTDSPFETYRTLTSTRRRHIGAWPVAIVTTTYEEVDREFVIMSERESEALASEAALDDLVALLGEAFEAPIDPEFSMELGESGGLPMLEVTARTEVIEQIAIFEQAIFSERMGGDEAGWESDM